MLKSLVDWEKSHKELEKQNKGKESSEETVFPRDSNEYKSTEDSVSNFEKLKAHKSTIEAVIFEVCRSAFLFLSNEHHSRKSYFLVIQFYKYIFSYFR